MFQIKNLQFQPLTLHKTDGQAIHLGPRGTDEITQADLSPEIKRAVNSKMIILTLLEPEEPKSKSKAKTTRRRSRK